MSEPTNVCEHEWIDISTHADIPNRREVCGRCKITRIDCVELAANLGAFLAQHTWTNEKPTQEGWYWFNDGFDGDITVVVVHSGRSGLHANIAFRIDDYMSLDELKGRWAGPLHPPACKEMR